MLGSVRLLIVGLLLVVFSWAGISVAADSPQASPLILSIGVEGNRNVEKEAVLAKIKTQAGQRLDRRQLSRDVRKLYKSGFFSDIHFVGTRTARGIHLVCHVEEYPLIANLTMEGNDEFPTKDLQLRMKLKPGRIYSPKYRDADRNTLRKGYLKEGYYQVGIDFVPTKRKDGRIDLLIRVHEGEITRINRINIIGNKAFSDAVLRKELASRTSDLFSWFSDRDVFDGKRFGADSQLLQQYYLNHGYLDMKLDSEQITMAADKKSFSLTFSIHEGVSYSIGKVGLQGDLVPDQETLQDLIAMEPGDTYSLNAMRETIDAITERVGDEGYAFATVTPLLNRNIDDHTVAVIFDIEKGEEVYIERIEISGNEKTEDQVVRRMLKQSEGARYSGSQVARSKEELRRAPFVDDLRVSFPKDAADDQVKMKVDLTEKKSGSISGGIGFSQVEKVIFTAKVEERNFLGKGYQVNLNGTLGKVTQNVTTSLTDPFFMGYNLSATVNAFKTKADPQRTINYQTDTLGGGVSFGVPLADYLSYGIDYQLTKTRLSKVPPTASILQRAQEGINVNGELAQSIQWDSRDLIMAPTSGHLDVLRFGLSGLMWGSFHFAEAILSSKWYIPFGEKKDVILNPSFLAGGIRGYSGGDVPLWRRYSLGGIGSMRGFDALGVSVRDAAGESIGGNYQLQASVNLFFPLPYMQTSGFRGLVFADAGTVWGSASATVGATTVNVHEPFSLSRVRYAAGFGIEWLSPLGPIGLSWAYPIKKMPGDIEKTFEFALGTSF
ncbi:MAG: outer membrane protein assembly factor BamA [Mariprofundus sp.]